MKKSIWHLSRCATVCTVFLFVQQSIRSQVSNPSTWESFVRSSANISVRDTFRMQTFEGLLTDNWSYASEDDLLVFDVSEESIPKKRGIHSLKLPLGTQVSFKHYPLDIYKDININVHKGGIHLMPGELLQVKTYRPDKPEFAPIETPLKDDATCKFHTTAITGNPPGIDIITSAPVTNTKGGCYYIDSVYAHGMIPTYSLFTGNSDWNDTTHWSHLTAYRHRNALINGNISINTNISCKDIFIGDGNIRILPTGNLSANNLTIYPDDDNLASSSTLRSSGTINITGKITIEKTFAQKGKWYFISFPFDVYAPGIDPDFQLSDDQSDTNGNYFYVQTYNGEKRANSQSQSNNWEVISRTIANTSQPIFKRNKGYLIALDASADRQTLRFASKEGDIPNDFGKNGQAPIQITINTQSKSQNHNGWYLCGNPLPAPLSLNQIESNSTLDGYIYIYDGSTYQPYAIGSDFAIPPFSAFFVKANKSTILSVHNAPDLADYKLLSTNIPMIFPTSEPQPLQEPPVSNQALSFPDLRYHFGKRSLFIENLPSLGKVELFTPTGILVFSQAVQAGSSTVPLSLPQGLYILIIRTEHYRAQYKCVLTS